MKKSKLQSKFKKGNLVPKVSLNYEPTKIKKSVLNSTEKQVEFVRNFFDKKQMYLQEKLVMVMLNSLDEPIGVSEIYKGTSDTIEVDNRDILMLLIQSKADKFYLVHNHPTDNIHPSIEDVSHSNGLNLMTKYLDISLYVNDIIITLEEHFSLFDEGLILN